MLFFTQKRTVNCFKLRLSFSQRASFGLLKVETGSFSLPLAFPGDIYYIFMALLDKSQLDRFTFT